MMVMLKGIKQYVSFMQMMPDMMGYTKEGGEVPPDPLPSQQSLPMKMTKPMGDGDGVERERSVVWSGDGGGQ